MKNKKSLSLLLALFLMLLPLSACDKKPGGSEGGEEEIESMVDVKYRGWGFVTVDDSYLFDSIHHISTDYNPDNSGNPFGKLNLKTGISSVICRDETCTHTEQEGCKAGPAGTVYFAWNRKLFYSTGIEEWSADHTELLGTYAATASYDVETGEYRTYGKHLVSSLSFTDYPTRDGDKMYTYGRFPIVEKPETEEDYRRAIYETDLNTGKETLLFTEDNNHSISTAGTFLFVDNGWAYFFGSQEGIFIKCSLDGKETAVLMKRNAASVIPDGFGISFYDGWIYFRARSGSDDSVRCLARMNAETGDVEYLSGEDTEWFIITNKHIYYQLGVPKETKAFPIRCRNLDGSGERDICIYEEGHSITDALYGNGALYFWHLSPVYRMDVTTGKYERVTGNGWGKSE